MAVEELGVEIVVKGFAQFLSLMKAADTATDKVADGLDGAGASAKSAMEKFTSLGKSVGKMAKSAKKAFDALQPVGIALSAIGIAGVVAISGMVKEAITFESQAALMAIASGEAGDAFEELSAAAIKVGGDTRLVGVSASGAADAITELFKAGFTTSQIFGDLNGFMKEGAELGGVLGASINLAAASEFNMAQASEALAVAMKTFGIATSDADVVADNFVQTADASVASVSELTQAMVNVAPDAAAFGFSLEDVNTGLALLSERGIKGSEAGTALKSMMVNLMRPTDAVKETLKELNIELFTEEGVMKSLPEILSNLESSMAGLTDQQRLQAVQTLAGTFGMKAMNTLLAEGAEGWGEMEVAISQASTTSEIAAVRAATLAGKIEAFEGTLETAKIMLGTQFTPALGDAVSAGTKLLEWFNNLSPSAQEATATILGLGTALAAGAGAFILMTPRIIATAQAMATMIPLALEVGRGLQLLKAGATAAQVAATGFSGVLAVALPILIAVAAAVAAIVAIRKFAIELQEQHTEAGNAWTEALEKQVEEGKSATEIAREYANAQTRVAQVLGDTSAGMRLFIDEEQLAEDSTVGLRDALVATSSSYDEYVAATQKAAAAAGFLIDVDGDLIDKTGQLVQENFLLNEGLFEAASGINETAERMEAAAESTDGYKDRLAEARIEIQGVTQSTEELAAATEAAEAQMSALEETISGPVGAENEKYRDAQADIRLKIDETTTALALAEEEFGVVSGEAATHRGALSALKGELGELGAAHRETMNQIVFEMLTARLAAEGWTQAEADLALEVATDMGIIDAETRDAAIAMNAALEDFATGPGQAETKATILEIAGELAGIPTEVPINIRVHTHYSQSGVPPTATGAVVGGGGAVPGLQHGTPFVRRTGLAFLHRGEAVLPAAQAASFRQNIANNNQTTNFNLTTQSTTRPGGLAMEFGRMQFLGAGASR